MTTTAKTQAKVPRMNKLMLLLGILALIPAVSAVIEITGTTIYGGDTAVIETISQCINLTVEVSAILEIESLTPEIREYNLHDCTLEYSPDSRTDIWQCNCTDGFELRISTLINTVNTYTFRINYTQEEEQLPLGPSEITPGISGRVIIAPETEEFIQQPPAAEEQETQPDPEEEPEEEHIEEEIVTNILQQPEHQEQDQETTSFAERITAAVVGIGEQAANWGMFIILAAALLFIFFYLHKKKKKTT